MFTTWFDRSARRQPVRHGTLKTFSLRFVPQVVSCEDRLLPGQLLSFSPGPLGGPLTACLSPLDSESATPAPQARFLTDSARDVYSSAAPALVPESLTPQVQAPDRDSLPTNGTGVALDSPSPAATTSPVELLTRAASRATPDTVTLTGTLGILDATDASGLDQPQHYLDTGNNHLPLILDSTAADYSSGTIVTAHGRLDQNGLIVAPNGLVAPSTADAQADSADGLVASDQSGGGQDGGSSGSTPSATGLHTVLVINVNFSNNKSQPWTVSSVNSLFNTSVNHWFTEGSYGKMTVRADVAGWYTIASSSQSCSTSTWASQAQSAARAHGYNPSNYTHVIIAFPHVSACSWAGLGQEPGRMVWLNGTKSLNVIVHEMGHNLGLSHSHSRRCSTGPLTGTCTTSEYGDSYDVMGSGGQAHYHASYAAYLGWIPSSDRITLTSAVGQRDVALRPEEASSGKRLLRVQRKGRSDYLNIEVRQAVGYDSVLKKFTTLTNGVAVYLGSGLNNQSIIDFGYRTSSSGDAAVPIGKTLTDPVGHVAITPYQKSGGLTYIHVQYS